MSPGPVVRPQGDDPIPIFHLLEKIAQRYYVDWIGDPYDTVRLSPEQVMKIENIRLEQRKAMLQAQLRAVEAAQEVIQARHP